MKVIGAGLPRTATTTQLAALEMLGYGRVYHMRDLLMDLQNGLPLWEAVADGNPDWDTIFGDAVSSVDWPSARFYRQLMDRYPEGKVLLSVRPADQWVASMRKTIWGIWFGDSVIHYVNSARVLLDPLWDRYLKLMYRLNWDLQEGALPGAGSVDDAEFATLMERYNDEVKSTVPANRLLVWDPADGWEPLCEFLEVPVPEQPVPRLNDTNAFREGIIGGAVDVINKWWDTRERPEHGLHGAATH